MTNEISDIVRGIVNSIDHSVEGKYVASEERTYICDTKWLRVGKKVTNEADEVYTVTKVVNDSYIEVTPLLVSNSPLEGKIYLPAPYFVTGTRVATNREWTISTNKMSDKTPLAWLLEVIRMTKRGRESAIDFESEIRIFFLDETDIRNYYTADHRENVTYPMERLARCFMEAIQKDRTFEAIYEHQMITFSRFGVESAQGMFENILDANLSGVELRVNLVKYKNNCKC
tara:strand:+ start:116 stop:802 length:687 start_codon:yes stop_codon:yes gene_type:complete